MHCNNRDTVHRLNLIQAYAYRTQSTCNSATRTLVQLCHQPFTAFIVVSLLAEYMYSAVSLLRLSGPSR